MRVYACVWFDGVMNSAGEWRDAGRGLKHSHTLTHAHTHAHSPSSSDPHTHATHTRRKKTHEGQRRLFLTHICASLCPRQETEKVSNRRGRGEEEERSVDTQGSSEVLLLVLDVILLFLDFLRLCWYYARRGSGGSLPSLRALLLHRQAASRRCVDKQSTIKGTEKKTSWTRADQRGPETHQVGSDLILHVLLNI